MKFRTCSLFCGLRACPFELNHFQSSIPITLCVTLCLPSGVDVRFFREEMPEKNFCIEMERPIQDIEHIGVHIGPFAARR